MLIVRDVMYCKPGKVRAMLEKSLAISRLMKKSGVAKMRVLTDVCAERYWTLVMEFEVPNLQAFESMMVGQGQSDPNAKEIEETLKGYHDLVDHGRREIYKVEE